MAYDIKVLELPEQLTLVMRTVVPVEKLPGFFGKAYSGIMKYLGELGDAPAGMPFGAYFNMDMNALEVAAGFPVSKPIEGIGDILSETIPGGKFLSTVYEDPYVIPLTEIRYPLKIIQFTSANESALFQINSFCY